jgi:hypothetical protein
MSLHDFSIGVRLACWKGIIVLENRSLREHALFSKDRCLVQVSDQF